MKESRDKFDTMTNIEWSFARGVSPMAHTVYGPVPSRRFGRSLGIDVVPHKVCTYDCVYCQLGPTTTLTVDRQRFLDRESILVEVESTLARAGEVDVITFAGSGEPTLCADLGWLARRLSDMTSIPLLLITNGSLLHRDDVANDAAAFHMVAPSLDAGDQATFARINRPHPQIDLEEVVAGIAGFRQRQTASMRLEVFLARGLNDSPQAVESILEAAALIQPDLVELNTAVRPTPGRRTPGVSASFLHGLATRFSCPAQPIAPFPQEVRGGDPFTDLEQLAGLVLSTLKRRPCTLSDLADSLEVSRHAVLKALAGLTREGRVRLEDRGSHHFYVASP